MGTGLRGPRRLQDSPKATAFVAEIVEVCRKHNMGISHQDDQGAFMIERLDIDLVRWLECAEVMITEEQEDAM